MKSTLPGLREKITQDCIDMMNTLYKQQDRWLRAHMSIYYPGLRIPGMMEQWEKDDMKVKFLQEVSVEQGWNTTWLYYTPSEYNKKCLGIFMWMFSREHNNTLIMKWSKPGDM